MVMERVNFRSPEDQCCSRPRLASSNSSSQEPLRLIQRSRWNCGCGYSGLGIFSAAARAAIRNRRGGMGLTFLAGGEQMHAAAHEGGFALDGPDQGKNYVAAGGCGA